MLLAILTTLHVVICLFLIMVVLLQQGKGADLSVFGGGSTQAVFGARGAATLLHKLTVAGFIGFIVTTISIGFIRTGSSRGSVMSDAVQEETVPADEAVEDGVGAPPAEALPAEEAGSTTGTGAEAGGSPATDAVDPGDDDGGNG